ncbi:HET-domain-containing protein [Stipitochalara longipes BDJ]|nr:HET-domain-containing protein [Stipitochalara longipes BDJ]
MTFNCSTQGINHPGKQQRFEKSYLVRLCICGNSSDADTGTHISWEMAPSSPNSKTGLSLRAPPQTEYQYRDLNPEKNEIRLLKILPKGPGGGVDSHVECSLFISSLNSAPEYQALSYTWEDSEERPKLGYIVLDGYHFKITPNLENAILELRSDSVQIFWIDALCINQKHDAERSDQVSKMRTIYGRAENVVVWLGSSSGSVSRAFSLLDTIYEKRSSKRTVADLLRDTRNTQGLEEIIKLFRRPYWKRIWVVQEVISAKKATVMCGKYTINWLKLQTVQNYLWSHHDRYILRLEFEEPTLSGLALEIGRQGTKAMELPPTFSSGDPDINALLSTFWVKQASDPKDRIYALIGLSSARNDSRFVVDYSASVRQVYINVVRYILVSSKKLDIICSYMRGNNEFDLPSWVPDWTVRLSQFGLPVLSIIESEGPQYCSAGTTTAEYELKDNDQILNVKGILLSRIHFVGLKGTMESETDFRTGLPILLNWYKLLNIIKPPQSTEQEAFCRTIFYDRFSAKYYEPATPLELMEEILGAIVLLTEVFCPEERIDPHLMLLRVKYQAERRWAESWVRGIFSRVRHRRFFVTNTDLIGISPESAEPGDLICILLGCWMPVVLRPKDGHYIFLGEAYIHGYMYGKAMDELAEGKFQVQNFEIH